MSGSARPQASPQRTLFLIGHAHIDPVWLWPWQEGYQEARATFASAIARMEEYPDFVFTCDQVVLLSWVEESDPDLFERIRERVAEGRWVNVGGWWVEPDCNLAMGESYVRQGLYGQRYLQSRFGRAATVGMNADPFGHNVALPQILRGQGMDSYIFLRPGPHEGDLEETLFWWESPDGSRVLAYRIPNEYGSPPGSVDGQIDKSLGAAGRGLADLMVFYGVGNHGGGPTRANIESIHRYDAMGSFGQLQMASPRDYFDELHADGATRLQTLPVRREDLQHHAPGCYSAHSGIKAWQRRAQQAVLTAERWAVVVACSEGLAYPRAELETAWKQVLFNQFHDVLPGSAIESAYQDARDQLGEAVSVSKRITTRAHNVLARDIDISAEDGSQPLVVFNPHPWSLATDVVIQYSGQPDGVHVVNAGDQSVLSQPAETTATTADGGRGAVVFRADLPALGYQLFRLRPGTAPSLSPPPAGTLQVTEQLLENDFVRIDVDPAVGWISCWLDKVADVDLMAGVDPRNHTQAVADHSDTWGHRIVSYSGAGEPMTLQHIEVAETGPLRAKLRIVRHWRSSELVEELSLTRDARELQIDVTLDWREPAHLLKLRFPTGLDAPQATCDAPFGVVGRAVDGAEQPIQSWVDLSGRIDGQPAGLTLITNGKHGIDVSPGPEPSVGLTVVRSPVFAWHDPRRLDPAGHYRYQDQGQQRFSYVLVGHGEEWTTAQPTRRAALLGAPVRAMQESFHPGWRPPRASFVSDGGGAVVITTVKGSEDPTDTPAGADLIVRAVETSGTPAHARLQLPFLDRVLEADFGPFQLRTFRVPGDSELPIVEVDLIESELAHSRVASDGIDGDGIGGDGIGGDGIGGDGIGGDGIGGDGIGGDGIGGDRLRRIKSSR